MPGCGVESANSVEDGVIIDALGMSQVVKIVGSDSEERQHNKDHS
jgi:hypothetical protein